jgi:hypothetical protein
MPLLRAGAAYEPRMSPMNRINREYDRASFSVQFNWHLRFIAYLGDLHARASAAWAFGCPSAVAMAVLVRPREVAYSIAVRSRRSAGRPLRLRGSRSREAVRSRS